MQIAVTTPTGNVGSHLVPALVRAGVRPVLLLRDAKKLDPGLQEFVEVREGDLGDEGYVLEATRGADALYWVDPTNLGVEDPNAEADRLATVAAAAVTANGIARTVFQSSIGAEKRHGAGLIDGMARVEERLDATGAAVCHLRCGYFFANLLMDVDSLKGGVVSTAADPDAPMPWVAPRDIAEVAATWLLGDWTGRHVHAVHGPADLTWRSVVEILSAATGRELRLEVVSDETVRAGLLAAGIPEGAAAGVAEMTSGLRDGFVPEQERTAATTTPTTLAAWAYDTLRPLLSTPART